MVGTAQSFLRVQKKVDKIKLKNVLDVQLTVKKKVRWLETQALLTLVNAHKEYI